MITQHPPESIFATLLGARRQFGAPDPRKSKTLSSEFRSSCSNAIGAIRALRQHGWKPMLWKIPLACCRVLVETYITRPIALLRKGIGKRTAWFMLAAMLPLGLALAVTLLPPLIFDSPVSQAYYFFAHTLACDPMSLLPILIGWITMSTTFHLPGASPSPVEEEAT